MQLEDRFYTSTEVAEILGVSLRSVYRYLEDGKLKAEVKTATGRHRFTKDNIQNFLYPDGIAAQLYDESKQESKLNDARKVVVQTRKEPVPQPEVPSSEDTEVDWLSKFREAASKYKEEQQEPIPVQQPEVPAAQPAQVQSQIPPVQPQPQPVQTQVQPQPEPVAPVQPTPAQQTPVTPQSQATPVQSGPTLMYYRSMLGGLKDVAQNIDKSARNSNLDYAFTLNAGASLHKPIKPFATLHAYVRPGDRDFFEKILRLTPANKTNAQLCLVISDDSSVYSSREEVHGLYVVGKPQLKKDIASIGDSQLAQEMADVL